MERLVPKELKQASDFYVLLKVTYIWTAAQALEALHKQVLPFLLRRMKENVLDDLPPKIIQDYYCDVSPLQELLFDEFQNSRVSAEAESSVKTGNVKGHVFQALQYLRKVCNHPALVLKDDQPETGALLSKVEEHSAGSKSIRDVQHAPKLLALKYVSGLPFSNK